jgi:hypothetical protein
MDGAPLFEKSKVGRHEEAGEIVGLIAKKSGS